MYIAPQKKPVSCSNNKPQCGQLSLVLLNSIKFKLEYGNTLPLRQRGHLQAIKLPTFEGAFLMLINLTSSIFFVP